jgi:glucose/arabinose dehydrogenase
MRLGTSRFVVPLFAASALIVSSGTAASQTLTKTLVVDQLPGACFVTTPAGDLDRLFVLQLNGRIRLLKQGQLVSTPFLDIGVTGANKITSGGERGLLGLAFHPNYAQNGFFYVNYTDLQGNTIVERYTVSTDPDVADVASGTVVIGPITQPQSNHNGGCVQFGPDGKLYIGMGDGGGANDSGAGHAVGGNGQSGATLLGKMLRLDVDLPFPHIPPDNPYVQDPTVLDEIWAFGLRNPWRFSFDRDTGELWIGDVGQNTREEVHYAPAGAAALNYGWRCMEGFNCTGLSGCTCNAPNLTMPVHDYAHGAGCATVAGGYVYRGCSMSALQGTYIFADYCKRRVWSFQYVGGQVTNFLERTTEIVNSPGTIQSITSFGEDALGELYLCDSSGGRVYRIHEEGLRDCNVNSIADGCDIAAGTSPDANQNGVPDECECQPGPFAFCSAKPNYLACLPTIAYKGTPKVANPFPFQIDCRNVLNNMKGVLVYGYGPDSTPYLGGTLCVGQPMIKSVLLDSGGNPGSATDCSGVFTFDFNAYVASGADPALVAGQQVNVQFWSRDPHDPAGFATSLSDGLQFVLCN